MARKSLFLLFSLSMVSTASAQGLTTTVVMGRPAGSADERGTVALVFKDERVTEWSDPIQDLVACSGTLLSSTLVLTASHCIDSVRTSEVRVATPRMVRDNASAGNAYEVRALHPHPDWFEPDDEELTEGLTCTSPVGAEPFECDVFSGPGLRDDVHDIALMELTEPIESIEPVPPLPPRLEDDLRTGSVVAVGGFGAIEITSFRDDDEDLILAKQLHVAETTIDEVTDNEILTTVKAGQGDGCFGDSGGPLYAVINGGVYVVGVSSRGRFDSAQECGEGGVYTATRAYFDWIQMYGPVSDAPSSTSPGCNASATHGMLRHPRGFSCLVLGMFWLVVMCARRRLGRVAELRTDDFER